MGEPLDNILPEQLQGREREILIWRFEQNMSYNEMANRLGVSADLCRKWVSQAIIKCLQEYGGQPVCDPVQIQENGNYLAFCRDIEGNYLELIENT